MSVSQLRDRFAQAADNLTARDDQARQAHARTRANRAQRLDTNQLQAASCNISGNPTVKAIWDTVVEYNQVWKHPRTMSPAQSWHAVRMLDGIFFYCADYMTSKVYKRLNGAGDVAKRKKRYRAFNQLLDQVATEMTHLGGRMLSGPSKFKSTNAAHNRNYWLERLDPQHRAGFTISGQYEQWLQAGVEGQTFWQYLMLQGVTGNVSISNDPVTHAQFAWPRVFASNVKGYDNVQLAQWEHRKHFDRNTLQLKNRDDSLFTTQNLRTEFSRHGWAVWVCSMLMPDEHNRYYGNHIFSFTHLQGFDHHSSFLGGAPVMAAGEWLIDAGVIKIITAKSGHYLPRWEDMHRFVQHFAQIPRGALIRPQLRAPQPTYFRVEDFLAMNLNANPVSRAAVLAKIPGWANNAIELPP